MSDEKDALPVIEAGIKNLLGLSAGGQLAKTDSVGSGSQDSSSMKSDTSGGSGQPHLPAPGSYQRNNARGGKGNFNAKQDQKSATKKKEQKEKIKKPSPKDNKKQQMPSSPKQILKREQVLPDQKQKQPDVQLRPQLQQEPPAFQRNRSLQLSKEQMYTMPIKELYDIEADKEAKCWRADDYVHHTRVLRFLRSEGIYPLKKLSTKFPRARWFCRKCEYHCDNLKRCRDHFSEERHGNNVWREKIDTTLLHLPIPNKHHLDSLNITLLKTALDHGLSESDIKARLEVASKVNKLLQQHIPGCSVRLYGSSLTGFGLKDSDINLDLVLDKDTKQHLALIEALSVLKSCKQFRDVEEDFMAKVPQICFRSYDLDVECRLSLNNNMAFKTSQLLADYMTMDPRVRKLGTCLRYWARITELDRQAEGTLPPHTFPIILIYYLQRAWGGPVVPCIHSLLDQSEEEDYDRSKWVNKLNWTPEKYNKESLAQLWIGFFRYYCLEFKFTSVVISIRKLVDVTHQSKDWRAKKLAIEDPFSIRRSLSRGFYNNQYFFGCLKASCLYFGSIQTTLGPVITEIKPSGKKNSVEAVITRERLISVASDQATDDDQEEPAVTVVKEEIHIDVGDDLDSEEENDGIGDNVNPSDWTLESWITTNGTVLSDLQANFAKDLVPRNMVVFNFERPNLTAGPLPPLLCNICSNEGHLSSNCPEEQLPPLYSLPPPSPGHIEMINRLCEHVAWDWEPKPAELQKRDALLNQLTNFIRRFWKTAELTLFGSSSNGFAFKHSDLDISLTFTDHPQPTSLNFITIIESLAEELKNNMYIRNVVPITSAKVPIVKLYHHKFKVDADISLYNVLARDNTRMLSLYSRLDRRVRVLGYMIKLFAKTCDIGDASRGSLSSYAYILMMIFYLQQCFPPVLPVLQEMYEGPTKPEVMVDGWNAWFQSDPRILETWRTENRLSVGQLWLGFLDFYAGEWNDKHQVVCIRQAAPLTKFEKMWITPCIAIEDPFDLSHNLGAGISRKMNLYIKKTFIQARMLYSSPLRLPNGITIPQFQIIMFNPKKLTDGSPPNDRGCRACGKIGHLVADCPNRHGRKKKQNNGNNNNQKKQEDGGGRQRTQSEQSTGKDGGNWRNMNRQRTTSEVSVGGGQQEKGQPPGPGSKHGHSESNDKEAADRRQFARQQAGPGVMPGMPDDLGRPGIPPGGQLNYHPPGPPGARLHASPPGPGLPMNLHAMPPGGGFPNRLPVSPGGGLHPHPPGMLFPMGPPMHPFPMPPGAIPSHLMGRPPFGPLHPAMPPPVSAPGPMHPAPGPNNTNIGGPANNSNEWINYLLGMGQNAGHPPAGPIIGNTRERMPSGNQPLSSASDAVLVDISGQSGLDGRNKPTSTRSIHHQQQSDRPREDSAILNQLASRGAAGLPQVGSDQPPLPPLKGQAINAEDLEAMLLSESSGGAPPAQPNSGSGEGLNSSSVPPGFAGGRLGLPFHLGGAPQSLAPPPQISSGSFAKVLDYLEHMANRVEDMDVNAANESLANLHLQRIVLEQKIRQEQQLAAGASNPPFMMNLLQMGIPPSPHHVGGLMPGPPNQQLPVGEREKRDLPDVLAGLPHGLGAPPGIRRSPFDSAAAGDLDTLRNYNRIREPSSFFPTEAVNESRGDQRANHVIDGDSILPMRTIAPQVGREASVGSGAASAISPSTTPLSSRQSPQFPPSPTPPPASLFPPGWPTRQNVNAGLGAGPLPDPSQRVLPPFNGFAGPFQSQDSGFASSVLLPNDIRHPLGANNSSLLPFQQSWLIPPTSQPDNIISGAFGGLLNRVGVSGGQEEQRLHNDNQDNEEQEDDSSSILENPPINMADFDSLDPGDLIQL